MPDPINGYDRDMLTKDQKVYLDSLYNDSLRSLEAQLRELGDSLIQSDIEQNRVDAVRKYIPLLVKALKVPGSFSYPFESLNFMFSHIPADSSFRLFNWALEFDDEELRYYGAIFMNSDDFTLYPLSDKRREMQAMPVDTVLNHRSWRGALYYDMVQTRHMDKKYYTLLGWDRHGDQDHVKLTEVLTFDEEGQPRFGAPVFRLKDDDGKFQTQHRVFFRYSKEAVMSLDIADGTEIIIFDMLVPVAAAGHTKMVPDGSYSSFVFKHGYWVQTDHPFDALEEFR